MARLGTSPDPSHAGGDPPAPQHVAIIMDGNGRWANQRSMPRLKGHREGAKSARMAIEECIRHNIQYLTLYAFSSENWNRSPDEVNGLMELLQYYIAKELDELKANGVRFRAMGDLTRLAPKVLNKVKRAEVETQDNDRLMLNVALSYGSRQEMIQAIRNLENPESITEENFADLLYTRGIPDPDLLIRTGGEQRISNFLLWQCAYTELYFTECLWPDFDTKAFQDALDDFARRERRFGKAQDSTLAASA